MLTQLYAVVAIAFLCVAGLAVSANLRDRGVPGAVARAVAGIIGGGAYLSAVMWLDAWTAVALSGVLTVSIVVLKLGFRRGLRGVQGTSRAQAWAEIAYPLAGTFSLAVGWGLFGDRWLAFVPIAFMAWGDNVVGLTRGTILRGRAELVWPSVAMLGVCLLAALMFRPYWVGALGAGTATAVERFRLSPTVFWDDNWVMVAGSLAVMTALRAIA